MLKYRSPVDFMQTPEGRFAGVLLAGGLAISACSGGDASKVASSSTSAASSSSSSSADGALPPSICEFGQVVKQPDGSSLYCEEMQFPSATVFHDYEHAALPYPSKIVQGVRVLVACVQSGPLEAASSAHGNKGRPNVKDDPYAEWYKVAQPEEWVDGYTAANDFWNVTDKTIPFPEQPAFDPNVPNCPGSLTPR